VRRRPGVDALIYSNLGLVILAGLVLVDFQRLPHSAHMHRAPVLAGAIFLDILDVLLSF
jgi:FtsH-binding integral membrane protein